jgi:ferredoxin
VHVVLRASEIGALIGALQRRGYTVVGPTVRDAAIIYAEISSAADLPAGWSDTQEPGRYRLNHRDVPALFAYGCGPQSWKKFLHPAEVVLWAAERSNGAFHILNNDAHPRPYALLGVRACELAAIRLQDQTLLRGPYKDTVYAKRREDVFIVAKQCTACGPMCFCASMGTGPRIQSEFDIELTELGAFNGNHRFLARSGSKRGEEVLGGLNATLAPAADVQEADALIEKAAASQERKLDAPASREALERVFNDPHWDEVAKRCLACGNCTQVCPTCFCTAVEDTTNVAGTHAERHRLWDSCFTGTFSYIHGGNVRNSVKSRYRQWLSHKLAHWVDQFGAHGCVGCGRCITWCPVGIDITAEFRALQEKSHGNT